MCRSSRLSISEHPLDERRPLIEKRRPRTMAAGASHSLASRVGNGSVWPRVLNRLSFLAALYGIGRFCVLLARGDYFKWAVPLLISSAVCKLLTTTPRYNPQKNEGYSHLENGSRGMIAMTCYQRIKSNLAHNRFVQKLGGIGQSMSRRLRNDNHYNLLFLSAFIILMPCAIYFAGKVSGHLTDAKEAGEGINHKKIANDFGKLGASALAFLLLPVSKHSPLLGAVGLSEVHAIRLHICAGCVVLFVEFSHGLYYTYIWIGLKGYKYDDVFPTGECWSGLWHRNYDDDCHSKFVNLLGIVCGIALVVLGTFSLYRVRRRFYRLFYYVHIAVSFLLLFGLVMHYNKMIWFLAPSLLCYTASNAPVYVESIYKRWRQQGVKVSRVVCVPDSGGCVELSFRMGEESGNETDGCQSFYNAVGKYIRLRVPEISTQSHPFTIFTDPLRPLDTIRILFRPHGSFTTALSKRMKALTLLPEPTPSEMENHRRTFYNNGNGSLQQPEKACPKMLVNGIRCATSDMFERTMAHDRVLIVAGGVGIVSYISLIQALRSMANAPGDRRDEDGESIINNHRRTLYAIDDDDLEEGFPAEGENGVTGAHVRQPRKRVDIHWMSRDEGLIRHVVENCFEPLTQGNGSASNGSALSINIVIHHTASQHMTSSSSESSEPTTWEPGQPQRESSNSDVFALPESVYQRDWALSTNVVPTVTYASIAFGGLWIVSYCYNNLQEKHVVETRPVSVIGVILLSVVVSMASYGIVLLGELFYSKLFAYSKLESNGEDASNEIECGPITNEQLSSDDDDSATNQNGDVNGSQLESNSQSRSKACQAETCAIIGISHEQGRPDLSAIVRDSLEREEQPADAQNEATHNDVGIFMCGPTAVSDSVRAATKETGRKGLAVYQEVFEL
ncbi:hypothetical protein ACHAXT_012767 [Thalassiosira profunda]